MKKLIIAIMVIIALIAVFSGCTNQNNQPTGSPMVSPGVSPIMSPNVDISPAAPLSPLPTMDVSPGTGNSPGAGILSPGASPGNS